jgi:hypothetical protein
MKQYWDTIPAEGAKQDTQYDFHWLLLKRQNYVVTLPVLISCMIPQATPSFLLFDEKNVLLVIRPRGATGESATEESIG